MCYGTPSAQKLDAIMRAFRPVVRNELWIGKLSISSIRLQVFDQSLTNSPLSLSSLSDATYHSRFAWPRLLFSHKLDL